MHEMPQNSEPRISIKDFLKKSQEQREEAEALILENKEKHEFLEDVPNWEWKLRRYEFDKFLEKHRNEGKSFFFFYEDQARLEAESINEEFGDGSITYKDSSDVVGRRGFLLLPNNPQKGEYKGILDKDGIVLPRKGNT